MLVELLDVFLGSLEYDFVLLQVPETCLQLVAHGFQVRRELADVTQVVPKGN